MSVIWFNTFVVKTDIFASFPDASMPACGCFIFGLNIDFIQTLQFAQSFDLDVSEHCAFNLDILIAYDDASFLMMLGWIYNPLRFHSVEFIKFQWYLYL